MPVVSKEEDLPVSETEKHLLAAALGPEWQLALVSEAARCLKLEKELPAASAD